MECSYHAVHINMWPNLKLKTWSFLVYHKPRNPFWRRGLSSVDLLIKIGGFMKKEILQFQFENLLIWISYYRSTMTIPLLQQGFLGQIMELFGILRWNCTIKPDRNQTMGFIKRPSLNLFIYWFIDTTSFPAIKELHGQTRELLLHWEGSVQLTSSLR
jgi:hypothetical protein